MQTAQKWLQEELCSDFGEEKQLEGDTIEFQLHSLVEFTQSRGRN